MVPKKKPAPDVYQLALDMLSLTARACIAIEDTDNGVRSAVAAGIPVVVVSSEYSAGQDFPGSELIVNHWGTPEDPMRVVEGRVENRIMINLDLLKWVLARKTEKRGK